MAGFHGLGRSPERRCTPLIEWPKIDRELWVAATYEGDVLDGSGPRAHLRTVSNRKMELGYGRFLTFLQRSGMPFDNPAVSAITPSIVLEYVEELRGLGNATATILGRLQELHDVLIAIRPGADWTFIRRTSSRVRSIGPESNHKRQKMVGAEELFELGLTLMQSAAQRNTRRTAAMAFRDGLLIALLALRPLRLRNLAALQIGSTLTLQGDSYRLVFEGNLMKNGLPFEAPWPDALVSALNRWLECHRPILTTLRSRWARDINGALWVSSHGSPMTKQAIYDRIRLRTAEGLRKPLNPHLFRDIAATTLAIADPKNVRIAAPLLGHANFATTEKYYLQARMLESTGRYQDQIMALRRNFQGI